MLLKGLAVAASLMLTTPAGAALLSFDGAGTRIDRFTYVEDGVKVSSINKDIHSASGIYILVGAIHADNATVANPAYRIELESLRPFHLLSFTQSCCNDPFEESLTQVGSATLYDVGGNSLESFSFSRGTVGTTFRPKVAAASYLIFEGDHVGLDDISISAVPEPSVWGMMLAGIGLIGAALRHRGGKLLPASRFRRDSLR